MDGIENWGSPLVCQQWSSLTYWRSKLRVVNFLLMGRKQNISPCFAPWSDDSLADLQNCCCVSALGTFGSCACRSHPENQLLPGELIQDLILPNAACPWLSSWEMLKFSVTCRIETSSSWSCRKQPCSLKCLMQWRIRLSRGSSGDK